jgi:hypothetical protein
MDDETIEVDGNAGVQANTSDDDSDGSDETSGDAGDDPS